MKRTDHAPDLNPEFALYSMFFTKAVWYESACWFEYETDLH